MLQELLACPVCRQRLAPPVTLLCGHTVCAAHARGGDGDALRLAPCPLPACAPAPALPNIPSSSRVTFIPAPDAPAAGPEALHTSIDHRTDVAVSKLAAVLDKYADADDGEDAALSAPSSSDSSDTEADEPAPAPPPDRPRKRRRRRGPSTSDARQAALSKELAAELTCDICLLLLYKPLTTPCQHTFCSKCLQRSLDHSTQCPACRHSLVGYAYHQQQPCNELLLSLLLRAFPEPYAERAAQVEREERDARLDTPIFVVQLTFPGMPILLHVFEPRYRLMLRRCLESPSASFGMIMPPRATAHGQGNDFGTMLAIRSVQMLPDGRSMVECVGTHRFRILERGTLDGYMVARTERIDDYLDPGFGDGALPPSTPPLGAPSQPPAHADPLVARCHEFLEQLRQGAAPWVVSRLAHTYGPMPSDAGDFSFWMAMLLPIDEYEKAKLLPIRSARLRLRLVVYWIEQLNSNWWFTNGCVVS